MRGKPSAERWIMSRGPLLLALSMLLTGSLACAHRAASSPPAELPAASGPLVGQLAPDFGGTTVNGGHQFTTNGADRVMVVYFFDSSSAGSRRPLRALQELALLRSDEVVVVGVSRDPESSAASHFVIEYDLTFPVLHDAGGVVARKFGVSQSTAVFVVDRHHQVQWAAEGEQPPGVIDRAALLVLGGSTRAVATK
jgi:peroxiredoxin